jgi:molybdopterin/thiamine biosynthesis adenylyltransferase
MTDLTLHEAMYRGKAAIEKIGSVRLVLCGAGALGSLIADNLLRQGMRQLTVIDNDRVEARNAGTQLYRQEDTGALKVEALRAHCFRAAGIEIEPVAKRLDEHNALRLLRGADLVVDTFDNSASRRAVSETCTQHGFACLHLGMNGGYGEVRWNEGYRVPADVAEGDACEVPLARNLILLVVAAGSEAALRYLVDGRMDNYAITLQDLKIQLSEH